MIAARSNAQAVERAGPRIWAVAGGKGGVGKSVVTANLAVAFASRGKRCAIVDLDLGGANVHTLLGERAPTPTLAQFLNGRVKNLSDILHATAQANLSLVSGNHALLEMANPKHSQKQKLLRHLRKLDVDIVLLDLGAGSAFNVLDFFLGADRGILVTVPEPTAIENTYHFLKAAFYRSLRSAMRDNEIQPAIRKVLEDRARSGVRTPSDLIRAVTEAEPEAGQILRESLKQFSPMLVVNQAVTIEHKSLGAEIGRACRDQLDTDVVDLGALDRDECVRDAVSRRTPVLSLYPGCPFSRKLETIAGSLLDRGLRSAPLGSISREAPPAARVRSGETPLCAAGLEPSTPGTRTRPVPVSIPASAQSPIPAETLLDVNKPGISLRRRREYLQLELRELIERTRIRVLAAIEDELFAELPPEPYLRGYVAQYASELGIREVASLTNRYIELYRAAIA